MKEIVVILEIANGFVKHSGSAIAAAENFPGAKVGETWDIDIKGFKIVSAEKVDSGKAPGCTCNAYQLENYGCKCGAATRLRAEKGNE